ncbi:hypothetical protein JCM10212_007156 [Sporobolomyces blumeae]
MVFHLALRRSSQASLSLRRTSASSRSSSVSSTSSSTSGASLYEPLEQPAGAVPHELVEASIATNDSKARTSHSRVKHHALKSSPAPQCTLELERERWTSFSFPSNHTHHHVCPKHGIRHNAALALPGRDERSFSCGESFKSSSSWSSLSKFSLRRTTSCRT